MSGEPGSLLGGIVGGQDLADILERKLELAQ
jgi:hypothetical protein